MTFSACLGQITVFDHVLCEFAILFNSKLENSDSPGFGMRFRFELSLIIPFPLLFLAVNSFLTST